MVRDAGGNWLAPPAPAQSGAGCVRLPASGVYELVVGNGSGLVKHSVTVVAAVVRVPEEGEGEGGRGGEVGAAVLDAWATDALTRAGGAAEPMLPRRMDVPPAGATGGGGAAGG